MVVVVAVGGASVAIRELPKVRWSLPDVVESTPRREELVAQSCRANGHLSRYN